MLGKYLCQRRKTVNTKLYFPVGISDFKKIRENDYYYIDKSGLIKELLKRESAEVTLITRPRRFGKTMGMSMLAHFFDIRSDNRRLFDGLEITRDEALCGAWMNQYPVVFLTLKDIDGLTFEDAYERLAVQISNLYKEHAYLLESERMDSDDRTLFKELKSGSAGKIQIGQSLHTMSTALKDNTALRFAVITGCLKIAKESIFTGTNNFVSDNITDSRFNEYFGFTQEEVDQILADANVSGKAEEVKRWYDGYHFGRFDVYCPWDVMNYMRDLQQNPEAAPASYWKNTSDNAVIRSFIEYAGSNITKKLETLLAGEYIIQRIDENLTYDYLHSSEDNLWSILYLTGYLTKVREGDLKVPVREDMAALTIPNAEIQEIFESTIIKWFDDSAKIWNRSALFDAVWAGNSEKVTQEMNVLLRKTISYHDYKEDFYHAFLAGIFTGAGYSVESNREHGEGRSDIVVYDTMNGRVAVFEAKLSRSVDRMEADCDTALEQITDRMYMKELEEDYDQIFGYGIAFFKKRCLLKKIEQK